VVAEVVAGIAASSTALLADAAHNASDVSGLLIGWGALRLARRPPTGRYTYGLRRGTILATLANALLIVAAVGGVAWEAMQRIGHPPDVKAPIVLGVAALGILINGGSALLFARARHSDLNARGVYLHLLADAAVSAAVVVGAGVIAFTGWNWLDPAISVVVSAVVLVSTWGLLRSALDLALDAVPGHLDIEHVREALLEIPGVTDVPDLHLWAISTTETAVTAHLATETHDASLGPRAARLLCDRFALSHATVQIDGPDADCQLACSRPSAG
jgi:cobalt-zinc-cadmium efflux system protein